MQMRRIMKACLVLIEGTCEYLSSMPGRAGPLLDRQLLDVFFFGQIGAWPLI